MKKLVWLGALAGAVLLAGCNSSGGGSATAESSGSVGSTGGTKGTIAFLTNNASDYWILAKKGVEKAADDVKDYKVQFIMNSNTDPAGAQKQKLEDLLTDGVKGIAVSPVDPKNQTEELNKVASKALLVTQDSDAPDSNRVCYIGTDNYAAGKMLGDAVKKALPSGGKIMVFVGNKDAQNAADRFKGMKDELAGSNVSIIDIRTDDQDRARAVQNVADAIVAYPDLAGCVGLWSYNGPAIATAVKSAKKVGKIQVICFDSEQGTIDGIQDGTIAASVIQQPYEFGYRAMTLMAKYLDGDKTVFPANKTLVIPTQVLDKSNIADFLAKQK